MLALATAAIGGLGCGDGSAPGGATITFDACAPLAVVLDPSATPAQREGLQRAVELWNQSAATQLTAAPAPPGVPAVPVHFQSAAAPDHGLYDAQGAQIFLNDDLTGATLAVVMAHEIGHAMGLVHIDPASRPSVMNPGNLSTTPTAADAAQLAALWPSCR
ncbi:MAG TPA: matrixin family metalloprotease [Polyangia bacterium]|nr:matrixin family metalloprotease [Polyangia bacterium]